MTFVWLVRRAAVIRLILLDLRRRPGRTALTSFGVAVGVAATVALLALSAGIERTAAGLINLGNAEIGLFQGGLQALTASTLPGSVAAEVARQPGVEATAGVAVITDQLRDKGSFLVFGVEPASFVVQRLVFTAGRRPRGPNDAVLGDGAAKELGLGVGDTLRLRAGRFPIVGVYHAGVAFQDQGAVLALRTVQRIARRGDDVTTVAVAVRPGVAAAQVGRRLERVFPGLVAFSQPGQVVRLDTNALLIRKITLIFAGLAVVIGAIVVMTMMLMAVFERQADFALLTAVGWPGRRVTELIIGQGLLLGVLGGVLGIAAGVGAAELTVRAMAASALVSPRFTLGGMLQAAAIALGMGIAGGVYPAWRVRRLRVREALG